MTLINTSSACYQVCHRNQPELQDSQDFISPIHAKTSIYFNIR